MKTFGSFDALNLPRPLTDALGQMGFLTPTPVQAATIPAALEGKDVLGTAQTGTGKTGAFAVPLLAGLYGAPGLQALVLAPTRELAAQIHKVFRQMSRGMKIYGTLVVGGESMRRQVDEIDRGVDYIIATPGRLNDHLNEGTIDLSRVAFFVLDEVDRMLDMGFAPQIEQVMRHVPRRRQTLLFSATLPKEIAGLADSLLREPVRVAIGSTSRPTSQVRETTLRTTHEGKNALILEELAAREGRILVFTRTKARTERLARLLARKGFDAVCLHGGRSQAQRKHALEKFRIGSHRILVATDIAGRGIDVADIAHVINYDVPGSREDYIHRIGRTGRLGKEGEAVTFVSPADTDADKILEEPKRRDATPRPAGAPPRRDDRARKEDRRFRDPSREGHREPPRRHADRGAGYADRPHRQDRREGPRRDERVARRADRPSYGDRGPRPEQRSREDGRSRYHEPRPRHASEARRDDRREGPRREERREGPRRDDRREGGGSAGRHGHGRPPRRPRNW